MEKFFMNNGASTHTVRKKRVEEISWKEGKEGSGGYKSE
jgi:hypothetical protein